MDVPFRKRNVEDAPIGRANQPKILAVSLLFLIIFLWNPRKKKVIMHTHI